MSAGWQSSPDQSIGPPENQLVSIQVTREAGPFLPEGMPGWEGPKAALPLA